MIMVAGGPHCELLQWKICFMARPLHRLIMSALSDTKINCYIGRCWYSICLRWPSDKRCCIIGGPEKEMENEQISLHKHLYFYQ